MHHSLAWSGSRLCYKSSVHLLVRLLLLLVVLLPSRNAKARKIRVRGAAELRANLRSVGPGLLELRGRLSDDDEAGLGYAWIALRGAKELQLSEALSCPNIQVRVAPLAEGLRLQTDSTGRFCLRWQAAPNTTRLQLRFAGDAYHGDCGQTLTFDAQATQQIATQLLFNAPPDSIRIDRSQVVIAGHLQLQSKRAHAELSSLPIDLFADGKLLAKARSSGDGKVRFRFAGSQLRPPRAAELTLRFAGTSQLAGSQIKRRVTLRAQVQLALQAAPKATAAGDEAFLAIAVKSGGGTVDLGVVEATQPDGISVASAPVKGGLAKLSVPLPPDAQQRLRLSLRYLPASPFLVAGRPLAVSVAIAPPSPIWRLGLVAVVLLAVAAVSLSWRRSDKTPEAVVQAKQLPPGVHVLEQADGSGGWHGNVIDAHSGLALPDVAIVIRAASLEGDGILHRGRSDEHGHFEFELDELLPGATLLAESDSHSKVQRPLPSRGQLRIALETRRRSALRAFVDWTRRQGRPFRRRPEATPGHVQRVAEDDSTRAWAERVKATVYGPQAVNRSAEQQLRDLEP